MLQRWKRKEEDFRTYVEWFTEGDIEDIRWSLMHLTQHPYYRDKRLFPYVKAFLDDTTPVLIKPHVNVPDRFGEMRVLAAAAVAALQGKLNIDIHTPIIIQSAGIVERRELRAFAQKAGVEVNMTGIKYRDMIPLELELYGKLVAIGIIPIQEFSFEPTFYKAQFDVYKKRHWLHFIWRIKRIFKLDPLE